MSHNNMKIVKSRAFKDRLKGHKQSIIAMYSPFGSDGHMLYSISKDGSVRGWDLAKREITIKILVERKLKIKQQLLIQLDKDEQQMISSDNIKEDKKQQTKIQIKQEIICACFNKTSVFGAYQDGSIVEWQLNSQGTILFKYLGHTKHISSLLILKIKQELISASHDCTIRIWKIKNEQVKTIYKTNKPIHMAQINQDRNQLNFIVDRNILHQINLQTNQIINCIKFNKHLFSSFYCQNNIFIAGNIENKLLLYDLNTYNVQQVQKFECKKIIQKLGGWALTFQLLDNLLYVGCDDRKIRVYNWPQINQVEQLAGHDDGVISLSFADRMLYSGSYDHSIRSWDIKEMIQRISQRLLMSTQDIDSKKYQVYYGVVFKNKKKKLPSKKKK